MSVKLDLGGAKAGAPGPKDYGAGLRVAAEAAALPMEWRLHDLRHHRCALWLAAGDSPEKVRRALGRPGLRGLSSTATRFGVIREDARRLELDDMNGGTTAPFLSPDD